MDDSPPKWFTSVEVGDYVARGPRWPLGDMSDGGPGGLGIVEQVDSSEMKVRRRVEQSPLAVFSFPFPFISGP